MKEFENARFLIIPGHYDYFGGAERQSIILARSLQEDFGCQVGFLGWGGDGILADKIRNLGLKPWIFPLPDQIGRVKMAAALFSLARFIKNEIQPDYLLPFVSHHSKIIGSIWRHTGARFAWWNQRDEGRLVYGTRTERRLMRTLPSIVSNSLEGRDFLVNKFSLPPERVKVINNGIRLPSETDSTVWRERLRLSPNDILITMVANLTQFKDHETLLRAFALVKQTRTGDKCKLVFAGKHGETAKDTKALTFDLKLGASVEMPGHIEDVDSLLSASDLVVHSSTKEGCPNAVLEAMAHQKCVVGTDIPGMRQALGDGVTNRFLAPAGNADYLSELIIRLAESDDQRKQAGIANRKRIKSEFSVSRMVHQVLETILENRVVPSNSKATNSIISS